MATPDATSMTPAAALARHLEWLEYALAAAREEEARRRGRLERATNKNRDKRVSRFAEVSAEVAELGALVEGIKSLQAAAARAATNLARAASSTRGPSTKRGGAAKTSRRSTRASRTAAKTDTAAASPDATAPTNGTGPAEPAAKKPATRSRSSSSRSGSRTSSAGTPRARTRRTGSSS